MHINDSIVINAAHNSAIRVQNSTRQKRMHVVRQWRLQFRSALPSTGCLNASRRACRNSRFTPCLRERAVELEIAVLVVAEDRVPGMREMHADLVRASGHEAQLEDAQAVRAAEHLDPRDRFHAAFLHRDPPLAFRVDILVERILDVEMLAGRHAFDDRDVDFLDLAVAQHAVQFDQRAALLRHDQQARRVAVEAMREFEHLRFRARRAQQFDDARGSRRCRHGPRRRRACRSPGGTGLRERSGRPNGFAGALAFGAATLIGGTLTLSPILTPVVGLDPAAVDPDFAAADHPVDMAFRHALEVAQQEVVEALRLAFLPTHSQRLGGRTRLA